MSQRLLSVLLANAVLAAPLWAVDYDKIDRSIAKQPVLAGW